MIIYTRLFIWLVYICECNFVIHLMIISASLNDATSKILWHDICNFESLVTCFIASHMTKSITIIFIVSWTWCCYSTLPQSLLIHSSMICTMMLNLPQIIASRKISQGQEPKDFNVKVLWFHKVGYKEELFPCINMLNTLIENADVTSWTLKS